MAGSDIGTPAPESAELLDRYRAVTMLPPEYPYDVRVQRVDARCLIHIRIDRMGKVTSATIKKSTGYSMLDNAAIRATKRWKFKPIERTLYVPVHFSIEGTTFE